MARFLELYGEYEPNAGSLALETLMDGVSVFSRSVNVGAGLAIYGTSLYGTGVYAGAGGSRSSSRCRLSAEGRSVVQRATYTGRRRFRWFSYALSVLAEPLPRGI
jgi:hypothetical protein